MLSFKYDPYFYIITPEVNFYHYDEPYIAIG